MLDSSFGDQVLEPDASESSEPDKQPVGETHTAPGVAVEKGPDGRVYGYEITVPTKERAVELIRKYITQCYFYKAKDVKPGGMLDPDQHSGCIKIEGMEAYMVEKDGFCIVAIRGNDMPLNAISRVWLMNEGYITLN